MFRYLISIPKFIKQISKYLPRSLVHGENRPVLLVQLLSVLLIAGSKIPLRQQVMVPLQKQNECITARQNEASEEQRERHMHAKQMRKAPSLKAYTIALVTTCQVDVLISICIYLGVFVTR